MTLTPNTSHNPQTDHRSLYVLIGFAVLVFVSILGACGVFNPTPTSVAPKLIHTIDGCDLYRFVDKGVTSYMARCPNGKAATTTNGKHVLTDTK